MTHAYLRKFDNRHLKYIKGEPYYLLEVGVIRFVSGAIVLALLVIVYALGGTMNRHRTATWLFLVALSAFAVGKIVQNHHADRDQDWVEIEIH